MHSRTPGLHHRAPVGLLVIGGADHEHLALQPEQGAGEREGGAPLTGPRLGCQALDTGARVLVRLRHGGIGLVRAGRRDALILVVDARWGLKRTLEATGAEQRCGTPQPVGVQHLLFLTRMRASGDPERPACVQLQRRADHGGGLRG